MTIDVTGDTSSIANRWSEGSTSRTDASGSAPKPTPGLAFGPGSASPSMPTLVSAPIPKRPVALPPFDISGNIAKTRAAYVAASAALIETRDNYVLWKADDNDLKAAKKKFVSAKADFAKAIFDQMGDDASIICYSNRLSPADSKPVSPADVRIAGYRVSAELAKQNDQDVTEAGQFAIRQMVDARATSDCVTMLDSSSERDFCIEGMADWIVNGNGVDGNTRYDQLDRLDRIETALNKHGVKDNAVFEAVRARAEQLGLKSAASANSPSPSDPYK